MTFQSLPLAKIQPSAQNPRKRFDEATIVGLAQSIKTDGLLQNLVVGKAKGKKKLHPIICGERRFRALQLLIQQGVLPEDFDVPVEIKTNLSEEEVLRVATVENIQRENLTPLEESDALTRLVQNGEKLDDIVAKTGLSVNTIRRRLVLTALSKNVRNALAENEITLSQAEAFSVGTVEEQDRVLVSTKDGKFDAEDIKEALIGDLPSLSMAIFDKSLYTGTFTSDLLAEEKTTYFNDVEQFFALQKDAALHRVAEYAANADWAELLEGYFHSWEYRRASEGTLGGVIVVLKPSGEVEIHEGFLKSKADAATAKILRHRSKESYPTPLRRYMAMHKSVAVQAALLKSARKTKELIVAGKLSRLDPHSALSYFGKEERSNPPALQFINSQVQEILSFFGESQENASWKDLARLFSGRIEVAYSLVQNLSDEQLERVMQIIEALEFGQEFCDRLDTRETSIFNSIAVDLRVDMRDYWRPDEGFLKRRNKAQLQKIIMEAGYSFHFANVAEYKKAILVSKLAGMFAKSLHNESSSCWLPEAMAFPAVNPDAISQQVEIENEGGEHEEEYLVVN